MSILSMMSDLRQPSAPVPHADDLALVRACLSGSRAAWITFLARYEQVIFVTIFHALRHAGHKPARYDVADIQADVVVDLVLDDYRKLRSYRGRCSLGRWIRVVSANHAIDVMRKRGGRKEVSVSTVETEYSALRCSDPTSEAALIDAETLAGLRELYAKLSDSDRRFAELFYVQECSFVEIADRMATSLEAIYVRKSRIQQKLRRLAQQEGFT